MSRFNRRDFLKLTTTAAAAVTLADSLQALPAATPSGAIRRWSTHGMLRHAAQPALAWSTASGNPRNAIAVESSRQAQSILGFGAAFTDAACYNLSLLSPQQRAPLFEELFSEKGLGLSVSRICIGSSDYARNAYSFDDSPVPDPELKNFSIDHDKAYILPILREVRAVNAAHWILASPWSPPGWMKQYNTMMGGVIRQRNMGIYARYFEKFLDAYAAEGVRVNSVTPQNEVDTDQDGNMPACAFPQEFETAFVSRHLGPMMLKARNPADIWILDHNYDLWGRVVCMLDKPELRPFVQGVAWHGYVGEAEMMTRVYHAHPDVDHFWTEGGSFISNPAYLTEWSKWATDFTGILRNRARCIIAWNYALDEAGKPNIGPFDCAGVVTIDSKTQEIRRGGQYWAFAHFSSHIKRGARVIESLGEVHEVSHVAALNPDGSHVAILTNNSETAQKVTLLAGGAAVEVELAPQSVETLEWK
jgi:glucosylceramidase